MNDCITGRCSGWYTYVLLKCMNILHLVLICRPNCYNYITISVEAAIIHLYTQTFY